MCTTLLEVCTRSGDTARALAVYGRMRDAPPESKLAPSVHAFTAAMRAAADGGAWEDALHMWADMQAAGCRPTGGQPCFGLSRGHQKHSCDMQAAGRRPKLGSPGVQ